MRIPQKVRAVGNLQNFLVIAAGVAGGLVLYQTGKMAYQYTRCIYLSLTKRDEANAFEVKKIDDAFAALQDDDGCQSLLKRYLDRRLLQKLKYKKTMQGATLFDIIRAGSSNHDDPVGVLAADRESYYLFKSLFDPIINELHGLGGPPPSRCDQDEKIEELDPDYVLSSKVEGSRTIKGYPFAPLLTQDDYMITEAKVREVLKAINQDYSDDELKGAYYSLRWLSDDERTKLSEAGLLFDDSDPYLSSGRVFQYWPFGRGVYVTGDGKMAIRVNEADHLHFTSTEPGAELSKAHDRLQRALRAFEKEGMEFARDKKLGYLTVSPVDLSSSTMRTSVQVKLPELAKKPDELEKLCKEGGLQLREVDPAGAVYELTSQSRLCHLSPIHTMKFCKGVKRVTEAERMQALDEDGGSQD